MGFKKYALAAVALAGLFSASANAITFAGTDGTRSASVSFTLVGTTLTVVLTNTSGADTLVPTDVLTGVFFNSAGLAPVSALLTAGSSVIYDSAPPGGNVGGEWAYGGGLSGAPGGLTSGISSSGLGLFGGANFGGPDLEDPLALDGLQYGIVTAGDNAATGNGGVTGSGGLIKNSVTFTLTTPVGFTLASLGSSVIFQYGTALTEPSFPGGCVTDCRPPLLPEPGSLALLGLGLLGLGVTRRRMR